MAKRKTLFHAADVREKIRATQLINRLMDHIDGKITLSISQVRAIDILLKKVVPDLTRVSMQGELIHRYCIEVPPLLSREEWQRKYGQNPSLPPPGLQ